MLALSALALVAALTAATPSTPTEREYLPAGEAAKTVTVARGDKASVGVTITTLAIATKESGPAETVQHFGEVYAFSPAFVAVHRDEPTVLSFLNLQGDDEHDFLLADFAGAVLMRTVLAPLRQTSLVFTFHREGLFPFYCTMHQPAMSGQILVLPPR